MDERTVQVTLNCKVTKVKGLSDPGGFRTNLVWSDLMLQVSAHNLNQIAFVRFAVFLRRASA